MLPKMHFWLYIKCLVRGNWQFHKKIVSLLCVQLAAGFLCINLASGSTSSDPKGFKGMCEKGTVKCHVCQGTPSITGP